MLLEDVDAAGLVLRDGEGGVGAGSGKLKKGRKGEGEAEVKKKVDGEEGKKESKKDDETKEKKETTAAESYTLADLAKELKSLSTPTAIASIPQRGGNRSFGPGNRGGPPGGLPNNQPNTGNNRRTRSGRSCKWWLAARHSYCRSHRGRRLYWGYARA